MANLNQCSFSGRLARDPEIRETTWIDCVAWEKTAEVVQSYVSKGSL